MCDTFARMMSVSTRSTTMESTSHPTMRPYASALVSSWCARKSYVYTGGSPGPGTIIGQWLAAMPESQWSWLRATELNDFGIGLM